LGFPLSQVVTVVDPVMFGSFGTMTHGDTSIGPTKGAVMFGLIVITGARGTGLSTDLLWLAWKQV